MTQMNRVTPTNVDQPKVSNTWLLVFLAVAILGLVCWGLQLTQGLQLTNLNEFNMWGLYIVGFMIFTGVAAGSLFFAGAAYLFNLDEFKPFSRIVTYLAAVSSIVAASLFIIVDIGNPERVWLFITSGNLSSPMFWDFIILVSYMIISVIFTRQLIQVREGKKGEEDIKPVAVIAFIAGILVFVTSFVFSFQTARPMWNNPVQPLSFLITALVAALAVMLLLAFILNKRGFISMPAETMAKMGKTAGILLFIELLIVVGEVLIGLYPGAGLEYEKAMWLVAGEGALGFWLEIIVLLAAIVMLNRKGAGQNGMIPVTGGVIGFLAVCLVKYNFLQAELFNPLLSYPGLALHDAITGPYLPSLLEIGLSLGIVSLGCFLLALGLRKLNLVS